MQKTVGWIIGVQHIQRVIQVRETERFSQCQQQILYQFVILNNLLYKVYVYKYGINFFR